jgi:transposase
MICACSCAFRKAEPQSPRQPYSTLAPYSPLPRAALGAATTERREKKEGLEGARGGGHLGTPARLLAHNAGLRAGAISQVEELAGAVQEATGESVELAYVDEGYSGERPAEEAEAHGIRLEVVKHPEAKRGFVLLPRRWVVERDFAWASRFRRLAKDYERLPATLAGLHLIAFAWLFLHQATGILGTGP